MLDDETVAALRRHWDEGWNGEDVATIMAPFATDVVFSSPFIAMVSGDPGKTTIEGYGALQDYVERALQRTPGIRYTVDATYVGAETIVLVYRCFLPNGTIKHGADIMLVADGGPGIEGADIRGRVLEWRCHYSTDSMTEI
jgi:hypothetical protein